MNTIPEIPFTRKQDNDDEFQRIESFEGGAKDKVDEAFAHDHDHGNEE